MAGKHVGNQNWTPTGTHPPSFPGSIENRAWTEGRDDNPPSNPHPVGTPAYLAYLAGETIRSADGPLEEAAG